MPGEAEWVVGELLGIRPSDVDCTAAEDIARQHFGIDGAAARLSSERDQNFRITAADGRRYVMKLSHPAEDRAVAALQTAALAHVATTSPALPIPHVVPNRAGEGCAVARVGDGERTVRLLTYLPGTLLHEVAANAPLLRALGAAAARLDVALQGFDPGAAVQPLLWDLTRMPQVRALFDAIDGDPLRDAVARAFDAFDRQAAPLLPRLRSGFTHHDLNPHNVLVTGNEVSGILDFGDMTRAPLVCDLAIAAAYHLREGADPLAGASDCVAGYHGVLPLTTEEMVILPVLIAARLAMTVAITEWRARRDPANADYILRNNPAARRGLAALDGIGLEPAARRLADACRRSEAA